MDTTNEPSNLPAPPCDHCSHWPHTECHWCHQTPYIKEHEPAGLVMYDKHGQPCDAPTWLNIYDDENYRLIAQDTHNNLIIKTEWLGAAVDEGNYETTIRTDDPDMMTVQQLFRQVYDTYEQAESGHITFLTALKAGI